MSKNNLSDDGDLAFCHQFIKSRHPFATLLQEIPGLSKTTIHGDPKVSNFIFDSQTGHAISLIDLDTVRRGLLLHDIGDGLRSCCNPLGESPSDQGAIRFDPELFSAWLTGYTKEAELLLTNADKAHIVQAIQVITFELGLRFFTDYMEGDNYFKISYPKHNLDRARVQFQLVSSLEEQQEQLESTVQSICK